MTDKLYAPMPEPELFFIEDLGLGDRARYEGHTPEQMRAFADACCALREAQRPQADAEWLKELEAQVKEYGYACAAIGAAVEWQPALQSIAAQVLAAIMAHAAQRPADSWRDAVEHELTVLHLSCPDDPKKAIQDLISWHCTIALDPAVSSDARALVERGRQEAQSPAAPAPQDSRPVPPPVSDDEIIALAAAHGLGNSMRPIGLDTGPVFATEQGYRTAELFDFAEAIIAARDAQWKGGV